MKPTTTSQNGFTLLELVTVTAVIAVLGAVAVHLYGYYTDRARAVDIIGKYDAIRSGSTAALRTQSAAADDCAALAGNLGTANLASAHAALTYGFQGVPDGYRPVLNVCAQAGTQGPAGVRVAREAHDTLAKNGVVEPGPVLMDSVVSFSLRLTDGERAMCKTWTAPAANPCSNQTLPATTGGPGPAQLPAATASQPVVAQPPAQAASQPVAQLPQPAASRPVVAQPPVQAASQPVAQLPQPAASRPVVAQPPAQAASQPAAQGPGKPVATVPGQSNPSAGVRPPTSNPPVPTTGGSGRVDRVALQAWAMNQRAIKVLLPREQDTVAAIVSMMAADSRYRLAVDRALAGSLVDSPVDIPTSVQAYNTVPFTPDMRRALMTLYPMAQTQACYMRNGPDARC